MAYESKLTTPNIQFIFKINYC